jgi:hypothetical protein
MVPMTQEQTQQAAFQVNSGLLLTGAALAAVGSLLGAAGLVISAAAMADATRRWMNSRGMPPSEVARQQLAKARAATAAGTAAWRDGVAQPASR